jgi:DNA-3-methyladenine glycosylase II
LSDEEVSKRLTSIKGIGNWTAKMYLLFFLQREDILPYEDGAFLQSYKWLYNTSKVDKESITKRCKKWKPYTSIGARYLYKALDNGLVNEPIKNFLDE